MISISRKASTLISFVFSVAFMVALGVLYFTMPRIVEIMLGLKSGFKTFEYYTMSLVIGYLILAVATVADILLIGLLVNVRRGEVFTESNVKLLRALSWCVMIASVPFAVLTFVFAFSAGVAFVAFFVGICLRVVKNAFEEAVALKEENDLTV